jgi:hypothetical protein
MGRKLTLALAALVLSMLAVAPPVVAQEFRDITPIGHALTADDSDTAMLIKYHGTSAAAYVTVSAAGDLTFEVGDTSTVATDLECDASIAATGSRNGVYDVSVAACDTLGEVCDLINSQSNSWACVILDGLRSDQPGPSGTGFILAASDQATKVTGGYAVKWDTSAKWTSTIAMVPPEYREIEAYYRYNGSTKNFNTKLWDGRWTAFSAAATTTYGSGTSTFALTSVDQTISPTAGVSAESSKTIFTASGGATTAEKVFLTNFLPYGIPLRANMKPLARVTNSAAMSSSSLYVTGRREQQIVR